MSDAGVGELISGAAGLAGAAPAGGAPLDQLAIIAALYWGGTAALGWLVLAHRRGRTRVLADAAALASWVFRAPGWVALPVFVAAASLLLTMVGGFWDIGYHIDYGRDDGPLGNPGHYPMLFGFFGTFAAGILCIGLAREEHASPAWIRITDGWRVPVGAALLIACSCFGLLALPLDDVWHRIFGQDVTLWSPTHFMLLGGATMSVIAMAVLVAEGSRGRSERSLGSLSGHRLAKLWSGFQKVALLGGLLVGLEAFLAEYDWGVPLYRAVWQPLLLAAFSGFVFSAARIWAGRGGALGAWGVYVVVRLLATLIPVLAGRSPAAMPLLLVAALCVEFAAMRFDPARRPLAFGAAAGALVGTVGFAGEYAWSQLVMPLPLTEALLPAGLLHALPAGVAGGLLGGLLGAGLLGRLPAPRIARSACLASFAVLVALGVDAGIRELPDARAEVQLTDVRPAPQREALATVRIEPPEAARDAAWLYVLAWQGGPGTQRVIAPMEEVGDGLYRSTEPIPLHGTWKSGLRLQEGRARGAVPLRLPVDDALAGATARLPASFEGEGASELLRDAAGAALEAPASFTRPFLDDSLIVLRESKGDVPRWLWAAAIALIAILYALFIGALAIGVARITRHRERAEPPGSEPAPPAPRRVAPAPALTR